MGYTVRLSRSARKAILKLPAKDRESIVKKLTSLAEAPFTKQHGAKKLQGIANCYRLQHGNWRIVYQIENDIMIINVIKIAHRHEVYR